MPQAVLLSIKQPTSDSEEELLADIAPPVASDEQESKRVWITCAETGALETDMAPPSAVDVHREKSDDDTTMSSLLPSDEGELAKTAPPAPPAQENQRKILNTRGITMSSTCAAPNKNRPNYVQVRAVGLTRAKTVWKSRHPDRTAAAAWGAVVQPRVDDWQAATIRRYSAAEAVAMHICEITSIYYNLGQIICLNHTAVCVWAAADKWRFKHVQIGTLHLKHWLAIVLACEIDSIDGNARAACTCKASELCVSRKLQSPISPHLQRARQILDAQTQLAGYKSSGFVGERHFVPVIDKH
jgi:hypothetical protein